MKFLSIRDGHDCNISYSDGNKVRYGDSSYGKIIATIDDTRVREGDSSYGKIIAIVEGGRMSAAAAAVYLLLM